MSFAAFWVLAAVFGTDGVALYSCVDFDPIAMRMKIRITKPMTALTIIPQQPIFDFGLLGGGAAPVGCKLVGARVTPHPLQN